MDNISSQHYLWITGFIFAALFLRLIEKMQHFPKVSAPWMWKYAGFVWLPWWWIKYLWVSDFGQTTDLINKLINLRISSIYAVSPPALLAPRVKPSCADLLFHLQLYWVEPSCPAMDRLWNRSGCSQPVPSTCCPSDQYWSCLCRKPERNLRETWEKEVFKVCVHNKRV